MEEAAPPSAPQALRTRARRARRTQTRASETPGIGPERLLLHRPTTMETRASSEIANGRERFHQALPEYEFADTIAVPVQASPELLLRAFRELTPREMPLASLLGSLRYLPGRLFGCPPEPPPGDRTFYEQLIAAGSVVLAEEPGREVVLGTIGKFHQILDQEPLPLPDAAAFHDFADPAYQKLVIGIRVEEDARGRRLVLSHRTHALGAASRRAFARYWIVIQPTGHLVSWLLLRAVRRRAERTSPGARVQVS